MAKKQEQSLGDLLDDLTADIESQTSRRGIPDIITFVESKEWLALPFHPTNPINLFPLQKIMLKVFYRGSIGNENLELTEDEIQLCRDLGLDDPDHGDFLEKYFTDEVFRDLVLVWGRRSGKDFIVSIIATYEAMKLLECPGGDPYQMYELSDANTINILTVANSSSQANIAFSEIRARILNSPYFTDKFIKDGITSGAIYLLTPQDKKDNVEFRKKGLPVKKGSIGVLVGHSNSDTLLGMGCIVLILDEVASYKMTGSSSSGDRIYAALTPTTQTYVRKTYKRDENGDIEIDSHGQKIIENRIYDGKVISISSPRAKEGKFYELYETSPDVATRLSMRLATWDVNPYHSRESLRKDAKTMSEGEFNMEYGAEFSGMGMENFFTEEQIKPCFYGHNYRMTDIGRPGNTYFIHLDPATNSHNYGLCVVHREFFLNEITKKADYKIVVDLLKFWSPISGPINPEVVTDYVVGLKRRFHIGIITYDQWASAESVLKLRKAGIPNKETRFTGMYKMKIYRELENVINAGKMFIPYENTLYNEMVELQRKFTPNGFKVLPKKEGDGVKSDDLVDCLAGATYMAIEKNANKLPHAKLAQLGNPSGGSVAWRNMQGGVYGVGTGQQVSKALERRSQAWPPRYKQ